MIITAVQQAKDGCCCFNHQRDGNFTTKHGDFHQQIWAFSKFSPRSYNDMIFSTYVLYMFGIVYLSFSCVKKSRRLFQTCTIDKPRDMHANLSALFRLPDFMGDLAILLGYVWIFFWQTLPVVKHIASPKKMEK